MYKGRVRRARGAAANPAFVVDVVDEVEGGEVSSYPGKEAGRHSSTMEDANSTSGPKYPGLSG